ncbi:sugar ABC transporter permease [Paenibacillus sp. BC26]|uniref:ABC transporter permease n=1 Tax=Paenibacillus sp. BC26 TaxID=1881032 RepID=UPI000B882EDB|nr:ABC transporter permease subunit [Paenibacillus sp. BC26]
MRVRRKWSEQIHFNLMLLPGMLLVLLFTIWPMGGIVLAFKHFIPTKGIWGSPWTGWENYSFVFDTPVALRVFKNTVIIALMKIAFGFFIPIVFALMLNELRIHWFKRTVQTIVYLPHFLSWVLLAGILRDFFAVDGIVNQLLGKFGINEIMFMGDNFWFRTIIVGSDIWKEFGFGTIIYLAALTGINPSLYEAADIDGATRMQKLKYVTLPGIATTIVLVGTLSLQNVLNAGFDQIFNLYNTLVYDSSDIIDTYVFRAGIEEGHYEVGTAIGLLKSGVSFILIIISYGLASRFANYRIF